MNDMKTKDLFDRYVLPNYTRIPLNIVKGERCFLWDKDGNKYLDFFSGWAVSHLGHCHPYLVSQLQKQLSTLIHIPNIFYNDLQGLLAQKIAQHSFGGKTFFCNSGAEANEAAIKLVRMRCASKHEIISMVSSFHGRTFGAMTLTGQSAYKKGFQPLPDGFYHSEFNDIGSLKKMMNHKTAGLFIELIQGEGGVNLISQDYLEEARDLCKKYDVLLIFDEVQTGVGRTGKMFAYQHYGIEPDLMTLAKGLGGGFPIGALVVKQQYDNVLVPGTHASTFGGNPLASSAGLAVFETIEKEALLDRVLDMGNFLKKKLTDLQAKYPSIVDVRGKGLMLGVELNRTGKEIVDACLKKNLIINCSQKNILRLMPCFTIRKEEIDEAVCILDDVLLNVS